MTESMIILWDSSEEPGEGDATVYKWNGYGESTRSRSLLRYVDENGERVRRKYAEWIHSLGETRLGTKRLIDALALDDEFSYWWMTLFVEQSPWKSPAIIDAMRLLALEEIVVAEAPTRLKLISANRALFESIVPMCNKLGIALEWQRLGRLASKGSLSRRVLRALPHPVRGLANLARHVRDGWPLRSAERTGWHSGPDAFFFASYFIHLDREACGQGKFYSRHWEAIPGMLRQYSIHTNWMQHFLKSAAVPDTGAGLDWVAGFNRHRETEGFHVFLDSYLSWPLVGRVALKWLGLVARSFKLGGAKKAFTPRGAAISLWPVMRGDWYSSLRGSAAMVNVFWLELFEAMFKTLPQQGLGLFLSENQSWERALISAWRRHQRGKLIAVIHSTVRFWDVRYYVDPRTLRANGPHQLPRADWVALNGQAAVDAYTAMGYPSEEMRECEAVRYAYLQNILTDRPRELRAGARRRVLILGDYMASGTIGMLRLLEEALPMISAPAVFTIKPHPNFPVKPDDFPSLQLSVTNEALGRIMSDFDIAYSSNMTSASVDAYLAGLPVVIGLEPAELNFSPLRSQVGAAFISNAQELAAAISGTETVSRSDAIAREDFFFLDADLPRWKRLLGVGASPKG